MRKPEDCQPFNTEASIVQINDNPHKAPGEDKKDSWEWGVQADLRSGTKVKLTACRGVGGGRSGREG